MKTALLFVLAFVAAVGAVRAEDLLDSVLASSTMDTQSTSAEPVKGAANVQPAQGGDLLDGVLTSQPEPSTAERVVPSAASVGNLLDMTLSDPFPKKEPVAASVPVPTGEAVKESVVSVSARSPDKVEADSVGEDSGEKDWIRPRLRIGPDDYLPRSASKKNRKGQSRPSSPSPESSSASSHSENRAGFTANLSIASVTLGSAENYPESGVALSLIDMSNVNYSGLRLSGLDIVYGDMKGLQIGFANGAGGRLNGLQLGCLNYAERLSGLQLGFLNIAESGYGAQIGLLNFLLDNKVPMMPLINIGF